MESVEYCLGLSFDLLFVHILPTRSDSVLGREPNTSLAIEVIVHYIRTLRKHYKWMQREDLYTIYKRWREYNRKIDAIDFTKVCKWIKMLC